MKEKRILIVEDEKTISAQINKMLIDNGFNVIGQVDRGNESLRKVRKENPDLVIMDIVLAGYMDGIQTGDIIFEKFNIPVIFVTAHCEDEILSRVRVSHAFGYILKPFNDRELITVVEMVLHKHNLSNQLKKREAHLSATINSMGEGLVVVDEVYRIQSINKQGERILGRKINDVIGRHWKEVFDLYDEFEQPVHLFRFEGYEELPNPITGAFNMICRFKNQRLELNVTVTRNHMNAVTSFIIVFNDISERMEIEKEREQLIFKMKNAINDLAETNDKLNRTQQELVSVERKNMALAMAVTANHEINQPLMVLQGSLEMLEVFGDSDDKRGKYIEKMKKSISRIKNILEKFNAIDEVNVVQYTKDTQMISIFEDD